jgi:hypothetical protein
MSAQNNGTATIRSVSVLQAGKIMEVEIVASSPVNPQTLVVTGPDRLVLDFPNAVPASTVRNLVVNQGELKSVRVGRYTTSPPVTRVVLDLNTAQPYQVFPSGRTVIVKLAARESRQAAEPAPAAAPPPRPAPRVEVDFSNGNLRIWANRASLAEVLAEIRRRTGAEFSVPPGAGQEPIVANVGPAPARDAIASLLNGSQFNFVMVGSDRDPRELKKVFLTARGQGVTSPQMSYPAIPEQQAMSDPGVQNVGDFQPQMDIPPEATAPEPEPAEQQPEAPPPPPPEEPPQ